MRQKLGADFPTRDMRADPKLIWDWAQAAEDLGYNYISVADHVLGADRSTLLSFKGPYDANDCFHETFCTLSFMAGATKKVGLVSGVLILPQRQTALVAKQAAQIDILSSGRLRLGIGVGWNSIEYESLGMDWITRGRRQAVQVLLLNQLWTNPVVFFEGEFESVRHAGINPLPIQQPIPIWFGGSADPVLNRAAQLGQGWIPIGNPGPETITQLKKLKEYLTLEGRSTNQFGIEAWIRFGNGNPDNWIETAKLWDELGATHLTFYTSGQGAGSLKNQIIEMEKFKNCLS